MKKHQLVRHKSEIEVEENKKRRQSIGIGSKNKQMLIDFFLKSMKIVNGNNFCLIIALFFLNTFVDVL